MKNKIKIDRPIVSSEEISQKQSFKKVVEGYKKIKPPVWKNPWFYGTVGIASLAILFTAFNLNEETFEENTTNIVENRKEVLPEDTECIHKPIKELNNSSEVIYVHSSTSKVVKLASGTVITFPEGSLVVENLKDSVKIEVEEYHDDASVFVSGVMMDRSKNSAFESAGMISIKGSVNGVNCSINTSKPLKVEFALKENPTEYPFWFLDTLKKDWVRHNVNYKTQPAEIKNETKEIDKLKKDNVLIKSNLELKKNFVLGLKTPSKVDYKLPLDQQQFDLDFDVSDFPELQSFKGMIFEVFTIQKYDKSFTQKVWSEIELKKENDNYFAYFKSKKEVFKIQVRPILTGVDKIKAEKQFQLDLAALNLQKKELNEEVLKLEGRLNMNEAKLKMLMTQFKSQSNEAVQKELNRRKGNTRIDASEFVASFTITNFGVYNCDKENKYPKPYDRDLIYTYNGSSPVKVKNVYVFDQVLKTRFSFGLNCRNSIDRIGFFKGNETVLISIDEEGNLGYVLKFDEYSIDEEKLKVRKVDKNDVNLSFIQKILSETPAES